MIKVVPSVVRCLLAIPMTLVVVSILTCQWCHQIYHASVGANSVLEMGFSIDRAGRVDPVHAQRYKEFGDWIRSCYGSPVARTSGAAYQLTLSFASGNETIDRVWTREDQVRGDADARGRVWGTRVIERRVCERE
jgi:hypothetical protein